MHFKISGFAIVLMLSQAGAFTGEDGIEATVCEREDYKETMTGLPSVLYHGLYRHTANEVGEEQNITIGNKTYTMITRGLRPPIFGKLGYFCTNRKPCIEVFVKTEIPNFLTDSECDKIISAAKRKWMAISKVYGASDWETIKTIMFSNDTREVTRVSLQTWVPMADHPDEEPVLSKIQDRLVGLTKLPERFIKTSELMQVVKYTKGHHYHGHHDSTIIDDFEIKNITQKNFDKLPCCHVHDCKGEKLGCCVLCRYATVMYYLNDVEEGGETAFVRAQVNKSEQSHSDLTNLSYYCGNATVRVKPKKGTAVMWYNNEIDPKTGWLGEADPFSCHGGCDVIKGVKWIGNNWLNIPKYRNRHYKSRYYHVYEKPSMWSKMFDSRTYINPITNFTKNLYNTLVSVKTSVTDSTKKLVKSFFYDE